MSGLAPLARTAVALRWALLRGSLRSGPGATARRVGLVTGALVGGTAAAGCLLGLTAARGHGDVPGDLAVVVFTVLVAGWVLLPIATFAGDDLMDPTRLALLPLSRRDMLVVMGCGALVGVAPAATLVAALGVVPATATGPVSAVVGLVAVVLLLALSVAASRAMAAALSGLLRSRRGRDLGVLLAAVVALSVQLVNPLLQLSVRRANESGSGVAAELHRVADLLRLGPPGLLAGAPSRSPAGAVASLVAVAALLVVVLVLWERSVRRALQRPESTGAGRRRRSTALQPRWLPLPRGRVGAVAAKDLRYLQREPRRAVAVVTSTLVPVMVVLAPLVAYCAGPWPAADGGLDKRPAGRWGSLGAKLDNKIDHLNIYREPAARRRVFTGGRWKVIARRMLGRATGPARRVVARRLSGSGDPAD